MEINNFGITTPLILIERELQDLCTFTLKVDLPKTEFKIVDGILFNDTYHNQKTFVLNSTITLEAIEFSNEEQIGKLIKSMYEKLVADATEWKNKKQ